MTELQPDMWAEVRLELTLKSGARETGWTHSSVPLPSSIFRKNGPYRWMEVSADSVSDPISTGMRPA